MSNLTVAIVKQSCHRNSYVVANVIHLNGKPYAMPFPSGSGYAWSELQFGSKAKARKAAAQLGVLLPDLFVQDFRAQHCFAIKPLENA